MSVALPIPIPLSHALSLSLSVLHRYETPFVFIDFFAVEHEWGVEVQYAPNAANVVVSQADVGNISVYDIIVGFNQTC